MTKTYYSKVSYLLLGFIFVVFFGPLIFYAFDEGTDKSLLGTGLFLLIIFAFVLHMFFSTSYTIKDNILKIKSGFIPFNPIHISEITEITKTNSILSSPAVSFDRIEIKYQKVNSIIISPKDKHSFVKDLSRINPNIKINIS